MRQRDVDTEEYAVSEAEDANRPKTLIELRSDANQASENGIACPKCGCRDLRVIRTERGNGVIVRRRECRHCRYRGGQLTTVEKLKT